MIEALVKTARQHGASDIHLEPGLPAALRIRGTLTMLGEAALNGGPPKRYHAEFALPVQR